jgi:hypothetical protein
LAQIILDLIYPIVLGLDRLETASFLRFNSTFQYLAGLPSFPDPQTLRRFLMQAPAAFQLQCQHLNNLLLQQLIHLPQHRSRLLFDLDSTVVPVFGHQENATVGYNPRFRGRGSYQPLLCTEANSSYLWDAQLRPGRSSSWVASVEMLEQALAHLPSDIQEVRVRADSGFGYDPVLTLLEQQAAQYAIVARVYSPLRRLLPGLPYQTVNRYRQMSECEHRLHGWPHARRFVVARKLLADEDAQTTLFTMGPLRISGLDHQSRFNSLGHSPFLRWESRHGTAHPRTATRLCSVQDPDSFLCRELPFSGCGTSGLQLGNRVPKYLSARSLEHTHTEPIALQPVPAPGRAN